MTPRQTIDYEMARQPTRSMANDRARELKSQFGGTQRTMLETWDAIRAKRERRNRPQMPDQLTQPIAIRMRIRLLNRTEELIRSRDLSTPTGWDTLAAEITDYDPARRMWIAHNEYKHHYSNRFGNWWVGASYLCGYDDGGYWAVRVPRTITTIDAALEWHTPAAVRRALSEGREVLRQGDVWFVSLKRGQDNLDLPYGHSLVTDGIERRIEHAEHATIQLGGTQAWRSYQARTLDGQAD